MKQIVRPDAVSVAHAELPRIDGRVGITFADRYRIDALIGEGGDGSVYRALDLRTDVPCALKILGSHRSSPLDSLRFKREYRAALRLDHPNCLKVLDAGMASGCQFICMELMTGGDLTAWESHEPALVAGVALQVLAALDHIHAKGIIHRDIKPHNILMVQPVAAGQMPHVKLSDFGVAKVSDVDDQFSTGAALGSLAYMAPEQVDGVVDPRSDLFALGCVLYELLARRSPFIGDFATATAWLVHRRSAPVVPLSTLDLEDRGDEELSQIIMRLLATDPRERFIKAAEAYEALERWLKPRAAWTLPPHPLLKASDYVVTPQFVGRSGELADIEAFVASIQRGEGRVMCISGTAGLGKSKLVRHAIRSAELAKLSVEVGMCRAEPGPAFEPIAPLIEALSGRAQQQSEDVDSAATLVGASARRGVNRGLGSPQEGEARAHAVHANEDAEGTQLEFYRRLAAALLDITEELPSLIVLEDAQWADAPSLQLMAFFVRSLAAARADGRATKVGILVSHRAEGAAAALADFYEVGRAAGALYEMPLRALPKSAATELVASMLSIPVGPDVEAFTRRITTHGDNNPLFLAQVLHSLVGRGILRRDAHGWNLVDATVEAASLPGSIHAAIGERAARFSAYTKDLLAAAAVLGRRFDLSFLAGLLGLGETDLLDGLDEAVRGGFIAEARESSGAYAFEHDGFRESIYQQLPTGQRRALHRQVAQALQQAHHDDPEVAADLAYHWRSCGEYAQAYPYALRAAHEATGVFAYERAISAYEAAFADASAVGTVPSADIREAYADVCALAGHYAKSAPILEARLAAAANLQERVGLLRKIGELENSRGHTARAQAPLEEALDLLGVPPPRSLGRLLRTGASYLLLCLILPYSRRLPKQARQGPDAERLENISRICDSLARVLYFTDFARAVVYSLVSFVAALRLGPSRVSTWALSTGVYVLAALRFPGVSEQYARLAQAWGQQVGAQAELGWLRCMRSMIGLSRGQPHGVVAGSREAEHLLSKARVPLALRTALVFHGEGLLMLDESELAERKGRELLQLSEEVNDNEGRGWGTYVIGHAMVRRGSYDEGCKYLELAVHYNRLSGGITYRIVANARLQFERALHGDYEAAVVSALADAQEFADRMLQAGSCQIDGVFIAAAALQRIARGSSSAAVVKRVSNIRRYRSLQNTVFNKATIPIYYAGNAAWDHAQGHTSKALRGFAAAVVAATARDLRGELYDVLRLACAVLPLRVPERAAYEAGLIEARHRAPSSAA